MSALRAFALVLGILLAIITNSSAQSETVYRDVVEAREILEKIERGEPVNYKHKIIEGDLRISNLNLTKVRTARSNFEIEYLGLSENLKVIRAPLFLDGCLVKGDLDFSNAFILGKISFNHIAFIGKADFRGSKFNQYAYFVESTFNQSADFIGSKFNQSAYFIGSKFNQSAYFRESKFNQSADFIGSTFNQSAYFSESKFNQSADFRGSTFNQSANFGESKFNQSADFYGSTFNQSADFYGSTFNQSAGFSGSTFNQSAYFSESKFNQSAYFSKSTFNQSAYFSKSIFNQSADFSGSKFNQSADFSGSTFNQSAYFSESKFYQSAYFSKSKFNQFADFRGSTFNQSADFRFSQFHKDALFGWSYLKSSDFNQTKFLGILSFESSRIDSLNLTRAEFGKIFMRWKSVGHLEYDETAYLLLMGNFKSLNFLDDANECYYDYRNDRRATLPWLYQPADYALMLFYGYGVKPERPLIWSLVFIVIFAGLFWKFSGILPKRDSELEQKSDSLSVPDALAFSAMTFLSGGKLVFDPPEYRVAPGRSKREIDISKALFIVERLLGMVLVIMFAIAVGKTIILGSG